MLYSPDAHEPIVEDSWSEPRVREAIRTTAAEAEAALAGLPATDVYEGAAGVIWALDSLRRRGYVDVRSDLVGAAQRALERHRAEPDYLAWGVDSLPSRAPSSVAGGEAGVLIVAWRIEPRDDLADALHRLVLANAGNPTNEWLWGPPGSMVAARSMYAWTGEERWAAAWRVLADDVWSRWTEDGVWEVDLYGRPSRPLGPAHGFAGNVLALAQGGERLDDIRRRAAAVAEREALREGGLVTWPPEAGSDLVSPRGEVRLQWCHGAPGIVAAIGELIGDELLLGAAELTWQAGPLRKGPGLCHGTAGNGYALLKTFAVTGDERWLERARRFALHALAQPAPDHSLFLGAMGAALFAASCIEARGAFPALDSF